METNQETGEMILSGMGELHLDIIVDRLRREFGVETIVGKPQVAYKETIERTAEAEGKYIKQSGGRGQYGHVKIRLEPRDRGSGLNLLMKFVVALFLKSLFRLLKRESKKQFRKVFWRVILARYLRYII